MITHVPTPFDRLMERLAARFGEWLDTLCVDQTEARAGGVPADGAAAADEGSAGRAARA